MAASQLQAKGEITVIWGDGEIKEPPPLPVEDNVNRSFPGTVKKLMEEQTSLGEVDAFAVTHLKMSDPD